MLTLIGLHISGTLIVVGNIYRIVSELVAFSVFGEYKEQKVFEGQMDFIGIKTIDQLVSYLGIPRQDLLLPCLICSRFLDAADQQNFLSCSFSLVWRVEGVHGICKACTRLTAIVERVNFHQGTITANDYFDTHGEHVFCVHVRCLICLSKLSVPEIDCMVEAQQEFHIVRGILRGFCQACNQ